jgi:putative transposase
VEHVVKTLQVSEKPRTTQRKRLKTADDEAALTSDIIELVRQYGRYGCRRITALPRDAGWVVNKKRVARIWRSEGASQTIELTTYELEHSLGVCQ